MSAPIHVATQVVAPNTLAHIYSEHSDFVWRCARRLGAAGAEVDDVVQDVFVVVARKLDEFRAQSSLRTWLWSITSRVLAGHRRSHARRDRKHRALAQVASTAGEDPYSRDEAQRLLAHLLGQLDSKGRSVYVLCELEGMTAAEVARGLDLNPNTVASRLRAARRRMERIVDTWQEHQQEQA